MKLFGLNSAEYIKCKFIDFMLSKNYELIIGNELMYGIKRKLVDLVVLKNLAFIEYNISILFLSFWIRGERILCKEKSAPII